MRKTTTKTPKQLDREIDDKLARQKAFEAEGLEWKGHWQARYASYLNASPKAIIAKLGADHVSWILSQRHPSSVARGRARGQWDANNLESMSAYDRLAELIDAGRIS